MNNDADLLLEHRELEDEHLDARFLLVSESRMQPISNRCLCCLCVFCSLSSSVLVVCFYVLDAANIYSLLQLLWLSVVLCFFSFLFIFISFLFLGQKRLVMFYLFSQGLSNVAHPVCLKMHPRFKKGSSSDGFVLDGTGNIAPRCAFIFRLAVLDAPDEPHDLGAHLALSDGDYFSHRMAFPGESDFSRWKTRFHTYGYQS